MSPPSLFALTARAWRIQLGDPWMCCLILWLPPLLFLLLFSIMSAGHARNLPIGVVDLDDSPLSRALVRHYDSSPSLTVASRYGDQRQGVAALRAGTLYALVILPMGLERDARLGRRPQVSALVNQQYLLIGRMINGALAQAHGDFVARLQTAKNLPAVSIQSTALAEASPVGSRLVPLYNANVDYAHFLVPAMLPAAWQILSVAAAVLALSTCRRRLGLVVWIGSRPVAALIASLVPPFLLSVMHGLIMLLGMYHILDWPMHGSWALLATAVVLTGGATMSVGSLCYFLTLDGARGLSLAAAYAAPGLAYMGVTYPAGDMNPLATLWRQMLPISHYIEIQMAQANSATPLLAVLPQFTALTIFLLFLLFPMTKAHRLAKTAPPQAS